MLILFDVNEENPYLDTENETNKMLMNKIWISLMIGQMEQIAHPMIRPFSISVHPQTYMCEVETKKISLWSSMFPPEGRIVKAQILC